MSPTVSIIIPTYNRAQFIGQTIDSVLAQTFTDYEIIVVDDASTDDTAQVLAGYGDRIRVITLETNTGPSLTRNTALQEARGELIAFLDSDDLWYPIMLATTVAHLKKNPATDMVGAAWDVIDESGQPIRPANKPSNFQPAVQADFLRAIAVGNFLLPLSLLIRRKCFDCCGGFDPTLRASVDWDLFVRLAAHNHKLDLIDVPVARYRRHRASITGDPQRMEQASRQLLEKLFSNEALAPRLAGLKEYAYMKMYLAVAKFCHEAGLETERRNFVQMAERLYPKAPKNKELNLRLLSALFLLPETEHFRRIVITSVPEQVLFYYWRRGKQLLRDKQFKIMYERLKLRNVLSLALGVRDAFWRRLRRQKEVEQK